MAGETCPAPVDVDARVRVILHLRPEQELSEGFIVERHEAGLYVELRSADATLIGQRTLPAEGSCDELAQAAAVVLSSWLSDVHPDFAGVLPDRIPHPDPDPEPEPPEPAPPVEAAPQHAPMPPRPPASPPASPRPVLHKWDLALGLGTDVTAGRLALAGFVSVGYGAAVNGFGVSLMGIPSLSRQEPLEPGNYTWRRWPLGVGPRFRLSTKDVAWDLNAGPALGWLHFAGQLFDHTAQPNGVAWGGFVNLRAATRGQHWGVLGLADAQFYPARSRVYASGVSGEASLPRLSLAFVVGVRYSP